MKKRVQPKIKGKSVVLTFQDTLSENTTYSIDLGDGIADNNEGNIFPRMSFAFSTGDHVDSIYTSGTVLDAKTQKPFLVYREVNAMSQYNNWIVFFFIPFHSCDMTTGTPGKMNNHMF